MRAPRASRCSSAPTASGWSAARSTRGATAATCARRRRSLALALLAAGMLASALAPVLWVALLTFVITGTANGLFTTSNRLLLQRTIPEHVHGRAFGLVDSLDSWGFALAVLAGGALTTALGGRATFAIAGAALAFVAALNLKGQTLYRRFTRQSRTDTA